MREHDLADAARLLREREERVARQKTRLEKLEQRGHWDLAKDARQVLKLLEDALHEASRPTATSCS
jgi:predicted ribonuclease YlaK